MSESIRGGAADDDYRRRSSGRPDYDERPRRRPPPPPYTDRDDRKPRGVGPGSRTDASREAEYREAIGQRPPPDFEQRTQYDNRYEKNDFDESNRRYRDDRWKYENADRSPNRNYGPENNARNRMDPPADKRKGWFNSKRSMGFDTADKTQQQPPPPPPPPHLSGIEYNPAESERVPIHYRFPVAEVVESESTRSDEKITDLDIHGDQGLPYEDDDDQFRSVKESRKRRRRRDDDDDPYASPRRDAVTIYMSSRLGAAKVRFGSIVVGAALGAFIGKVRNCHFRLHG